VDGGLLAVDMTSLKDAPKWARTIRQESMMRLIRKEEKEATQLKKLTCRQ
jgi:hypothetical protein